MADSLKARTLRGAFWALAERLGTQAVGFAVTVVLARLLTPSDYGVVGMLAVFLSVSQLFIDSGFGSALIRKKDRSEDDYATVFWFNLVISLICYAVLFCAAPAISVFYRMPILTSLLRVVGLNLVIQALYTIQVTRMTASVNFKVQAKVAILSCAAGGCVGIALAYLGFGPWALVGQSLSGVVVAGSAYWLLSGWRPRCAFSRTVFRELFGFSGKILLSSILHTVYVNISPLIIGRRYSAQDLGYYSRGDSLAQLPGGIFQGTLGRVVFPVLASIQDDEPRLRAAYNKYLRLATSVVAPAMLLLAACSQPLVTLLIGEKWLPCVPYLQLLAIGWMVDPIIVINLNILYVKGRSDVVLRLEIVKKIIAIAIVVTAVRFGVIWLCVGRVLYGFIALYLNLHACGPFIGMSFSRQLREVAPVYLSAFATAGLAWLSVKGCLSLASGAAPFVRNALALVAGGLCGALAYLALAWVFRFDLVSEGKQALARICDKLRRCGDRPR